MNLLSVNEELNYLQYMSDQIITCENTKQAVAQYGVTKSSFLILKSTGLLSSTILEYVSLEAFSGNNTDIAVESLTNTIKEKIAQWAAKTLSFLKNSKAKISNILEPLFNKLKDYSKKAMSSISEKIDKGVAYAKAHPYKTIALALATALAALGIGQFITKGFPAIKNAAKIPQFIKTVGAMISALKYPFGKIVTTYSNGGKAIRLTIGTGGLLAASGSIKALGWTKDKIAAIYRDSAKVKLSVGYVLENTNSLVSNTVRDGLTFVKGVYTGTRKGFGVGYHSSEGASEAGQVLTGVVSMSVTTFAVLVASAAYVVYKLITGIVVGTIKAICLTLHALSRPSESSDSDNEFL